MPKFARWSMLGAGAAWLACAPTVMAHPGTSLGIGESMVGGVLHPLLGLDHLLAALASGLLAVRIGGRHALLMIPAAFVGLMLVGGVLAAGGLPLSRAEPGITLSVLVLGLVVAIAPRIPLAAGIALVGTFAICHGHAHVAEAGGGTLPAYVAGLALGTLAIHAAAIGVGIWAMRMKHPRLLRCAGAGIAMGVVFLIVGH